MKQKRKIEIDISEIKLLTMIKTRLIRLNNKQNDDQFVFRQNQVWSNLIKVIEKLKSSFCLYKTTVILNKVTFNPEIEINKTASLDKYKKNKTYEQDKIT